MTALPRVAVPSLLLILAATPAKAAIGLDACTGLADDHDRLACYDRAAGRSSANRLPSAPSVPLPAPTSPSPDTPVLGGATSQPATGPSQAKTTAPAPAVIAPTADAPLPKPSPLASALRDVRRSLGTTLSDRWELDPDQDRGRFVIQPYKPTYLLLADWTSRVNRTPYSPNPTNSITQPGQQQRTEAKFQISFKSKVWDNIVGDNGALWLGYTQTSFWQVYNGSDSRPFRETDYEPEAMLVFRTHYSLFGWQGRLAGISLNHQSNGRSDPQSRSWNRVIAQIGLERDNWMMMLRPWWRIPEKRADDNNPDIADYAGRAELLLVRKSEGHELSLLARHSLRTGSNSHGSLQLDYAFPLSSYLKGYVQLFTGYGDSLIDYNFRQTRIGIGISLSQWL